MQSANPRSGLTGRMAIGVAVLLLCGVSAWAADPPTSASSAQEPSKELREKMATVHAQMAACLRSDKSFAECRSQMLSSCRQNMGAQSCPMMGLGRGMGRGRVQPPPANPPNGK
jgi:hypothetical protein